MDDGGPIAILTGLQGRGRGRKVKGRCLKWNSPRQWVTKGKRCIKRMNGRSAFSGLGDVNDCVQAFIHQSGPCSSGNVMTDGKTFYSYRQPIARWTNRGLVVDCRKFSVTTSKHQGAIKRAAGAGGYTCEVFSDRATY